MVLACNRSLFFKFDSSCLKIILILAHLQYETHGLKYPPSSEATMQSDALSLGANAYTRHIIPRIVQLMTYAVWQESHRH
ncbi:hypothetical protein FGO68_gene2399 [Halteria grandinella]|uniref:Uncharacterized protein n=1 Tax=Halteria grandinella TaxID=5974 RepID=A0A8J8NLJ7_HALGN|nr:hypothetical protein FGO68_gene2399 [Halteria grandinella]